MLSPSSRVGFVWLMRDSSEKTGHSPPQQDDADPCKLPTLSTRCHRCSAPADDVLVSQDILSEQNASVADSPRLTPTARAAKILFGRWVPCGV